MIYQLKITLKRTKPAVWRRLQVDSSVTFYDLHQYIQASFEWLGYHLHEFNVKNGIIVGQEEDVDLGEPPDYYETEVRIKDFLKKEKDKCTYTYDFGDYWQHEILLEKVIQPQKVVDYPVCTKALREAPNEDSGGFLGDAKEVDPVELMNFINERLMNLEQETSKKMELHKPTKTDWHHLFNLVDEYKRMQPWKWMSDEQIFAVQHPGTGQFTYCSVLGAAGEEFGLAVYIGDAGYMALLDTLEGQMDIDLAYNQRSILVSLSDRNELEQDDYQLLKELGLSYRGKKQWPMFRSLKPGYIPWTIDEEEVQLLIVVLEQAIEVVKMAKMDPELISEEFYNECFARIPDDSGAWSNGYIIPEEIEEVKPGIYISELNLHQLKKLKQIDLPVEFTSFYTPEPVQDFEGDRPYFPNMVIGCESENGLIFFYELLSQAEFEGKLQEAFVKMIESIKHIPKFIMMDNYEAMGILEPVAEVLKIRLVAVDELPGVEEFKASMFQGLR